VRTRVFDCPSVRVQRFYVASWESGAFASSVLYSRVVRHRRVLRHGSAVFGRKRPVNPAHLSSYSPSVLRRRAVCARSMRIPWHFSVVNLWGLREQSFAEVYIQNWISVGVDLMRKRYPKRAPKRSSVPPIKSSAPDAPKTIQSRYNQPEHEPRFFLTGKQLRLVAQLRRNCRLKCYPKPDNFFP
jgi:hypothetical protein